MRADAFVLSAERTYFFCYEFNLRLISLSSSIVHRPVFLKIFTPKVPHGIKLKYPYINAKPGKKLFLKKNYAFPPPKNIKIYI